MIENLTQNRLHGDCTRHRSPVTMNIAMFMFMTERNLS